MCKYCNSTNNVNIPSNERGSFLVNIVKDEARFNLDIGIDGDRGYYDERIHINNCPMCGRVLNKELKKSNFMTGTIKLIIAFNSLPLLAILIVTLIDGISKFTIYGSILIVCIMTFVAICTSIWLSISELKYKENKNEKNIGI